MMKSIAAYVCGAMALCAQASAQVVYVDASAPAGGDGNSWGGAYQSIQTALTRARTTGGVSEVRVAQGTYRPGTTGSRIVSFDLVGGVTLRGGYAGVASVTPDTRDLKRTPTILTGDVNGDDIDGGGRGVRTDNLLHVVTASNLAATAVLDGFHIRGGYGSGTGDQGAGAGVFVASCGNNFVMSNCIVRDNFASAGASGFFSRYTTGTLINCLIVGNRSTTPAGGGGIAGAVIDTQSMPGVAVMDHCVVAYNVGWVDGAGCSISGTQPPLVRGSIFFGNSSGFVNAQPGQVRGNFVAESSIAAAGGNWLGTGSNKTGDPLFTDAAGLDGVIGTLDDDFRLRADSPCIDSGGGVAADVADVDGDGDRFEATPLDADGLAREYDVPGVPGSGIDMGAFEGPALSAQPSVYALSIPERGTAQITVRLSRAITSPVTVTIAGEGLAATPALLSFTPESWDIAQPVTVQGLSDADFLDTAHSLRLSGSGGLSTAVVAVSVIDADTSPTMIFVNPQGTLPPDGFSWASGMRTIEAALLLADQWPAATQVWIKEGTYTPATAGWANTQDARIQVRGGLTLMGGFAGTEMQASQRDGQHPTVISGDLQHDDSVEWPSESWFNNSSWLIEFVSAGPATGLDGLTLRGARDLAIFPNAAQVPAGATNSLRLINCRFERNYEGGVMWMTRGSFYASGCVFESNGAGPTPQRFTLRVWGEAQNGTLPTIQLSSCTFRDNRGRNGGASLESGNMEVSGCRFERCVGTDGGEPTGALAIKLSEYNGTGLITSAFVTGCTFIDNPGSVGAALNFYRAGTIDTHVAMPATVSGCEFSGNTGTTGAAIISTGMVPLTYAVTTAVGCLFQNNAVTGEGGAVNGARCESCTFRGNSAQRGGGAANATLVDCLLENNMASSEGGGAYRGSVLRCTFRDNIAPAGGGLSDSFGSFSVVTARQSVFEGNRATNAAGGGGGGAYGVHAEDCVFVGNTSASDAGGAFVNAQRCRFLGNSAARSGGGAMGRLVSCLVTGNTAGVKGGGCFENDAIVNCTVAGNTAPIGGGAVDFIYAENSIFWGNSGSTGSLEQQQLVRRSGISESGFSEVQLGRLVNPGSAVQGVFNLSGPMTGGFVGPFDPVLLSTATATTPGMMPTYSVTPPVGHLSALVVGGVTKQSRWVSTQGPGGSTNGPSALYYVATLGGSANADVAALTTIEATFAVDGQLGDATHAGIYLNGIGLPGTSGGGPTAQMMRSADLTDLLPPGQSGKLWFYNRNDSGFNGMLLYLKIAGSRPQVSSCIIQGLATLAGNGNLGVDPMFVNLAGADGVVGTADDDASLADGSPAFDSGNGRLVSVDKYDFDSDGNRTERLLTDLNGHDRVVDLPLVSNTGVGTLGAVDRGAVERVAPVCPADVGGAGGLPGADGLLNNNDFVVFIDLFFNHDPRADVGSIGGVAGSDGAWDNNDFVVFVDRFFAGCS